MSRKTATRYADLVCLSHSQVALSGRRNKMVEVSIREAYPTDAQAVGLCAGMAFKVYIDTLAIRLMISKGGDTRGYYDSLSKSPQGETTINPSCIKGRMVERLAEQRSVHPSIGFI